MLKSIFLSKKFKHVALFCVAILVGGISDARASEAQLSTANTHSCMITEAKTVECWGSNQYGQLGPNNTTGLKTPVPGLSNVIAIATGDSHSCAIIGGVDPQSGETNVVKCWGNNSEGQLGTGNYISSSTPQLVKGGTVSNPQSNNLVAATEIIAGAAHTCVHSSSVMHCWGRNSSGQLGYGVFSAASPTPMLVGDLKGYPIRIAGPMVAGANHTCAAANLMEFNHPRLYCWGAGASGQLGNGGTQNSANITMVGAFVFDTFKLSAGNTHTCARDEDYILCWGNWGGQSYTTPQNITDPYTHGAVSEMASGNNHVCAIVTDATKHIDRQVRCFGLNSDGQMGNGTRSGYVGVANWTPVKGLYSPAIKIEAGGSQTCALLENGSIACWGLNGLSQLGDGLRNNSVSAVATGWWKPIIPAQPDEGVQAISLGWVHSCALKNASDSNQQIKCWGSNSGSRLGTGAIVASVVPHAIAVTGFAPGKIVSLAAGGTHSCVLNDTGRVQCWGENGYGQLGNGTTTGSGIPVTVNFQSTDVITAVAVGNQHSCAILNNMTVKCWGRNDRGQLGTGTTTAPNLTPIAVANLSNVVQLSTKNDHTCALLQDKTTRCWGSNSSGQLGNGSVATSAVPVSNALWINDVVKITTGIENTCVLRVGGTVWCWGAISTGGVNKNVRYPENIAYLDRVVDISAGFNTDCVQFSNGTLKCFGTDTYGLIGDGDDTPSSGNNFLPNSVRYLSAPAKNISLGGFPHACAILVTGQVACWGSNVVGQLGNDSTVNSSRPVLVNNL